MADIEAAMQKTYSHPLLIGRPAGADLEGYIYGDTYNFYTGSSLDDVLKNCLITCMKTSKQKA